MRSSQSRRVDTVQNDAYCQEKRCVRVELVLVNLVDERRAPGDLLGGMLDKIGNHILGTGVRLPVHDERGERGMGVLGYGGDDVRIQDSDMDGTRATRYERYVQS